MAIICSFSCAILSWHRYAVPILLVELELPVTKSSFDLISVTTKLHVANIWVAKESLTNNSTTYMFHAFETVSGASKTV